MGGNAFLNTTRLTIDDLNSLKSRVNPEILDLGWRIRWPAEISDKVSFGDADFNISFPFHHTTGEREENNHILESTLCRLLDCTARPLWHGCQVSFLSRERFQVDVKIVKDEDIDIHTGIHSHGDFCWLMQLSLEKVGLLLNEKGLFLRDAHLYRTLSIKGRKSVAFFLSKDPVAICNFLGLPSFVLDGETSLSYLAVFDIVVNHKYFQPRAYDARTISSSNRPMMVHFCQWLRITSCDSLISSSDRLLNASEYSTSNIETIPRVAKAALREFDRRRAFNGHLSRFDLKGSRWAELTE